MPLRTRLIATFAMLGAVGMTAAGHAAPVTSFVGSDLANGPFSFTVDDSTFTFSSTGDIFNPVAVQTSGAAEVNSFGGFLGIPVAPTSDFVDRGVVSFGPNDPYSAFATATAVPYSNGQNFIGLSATEGGQTFFGYAYTTDTTFNGFGFETVAGQAITATTAISAAPEPSSWALMIAGVALIGALLRRGRRRAIAAHI